MTTEHGEGVTPHLFGVPPAQVPLSQTSLTVQNLPSSHAVPFGDGTTTQVLIGPISCPVLHTAIVHCGVSSFVQSTPHGPKSPPPVPLPLLLLLPVVLSGNSPDAQEHPAPHTTGSKSPTRRKFLM
jgi:hypothetical protein